MAGETVITIVGNLTADPELHYTPSGACVANFSIASTPRTFNVPMAEWRDGDPLFLRCSLWRDAASNLADSLRKGDRVIAVGKLVQRSWEASDGGKRTSIELAVDEIGPSLKWSTVTVTKAGRKATVPVGGGHYDDEPPF